MLLPACGHASSTRHREQPRNLNLQPATCIISTLQHANSMPSPLSHPNIARLT